MLAKAPAPCDCDLADCQSCTEATRLEVEQYHAWTSCRNRDAGEECFCGLCKDGVA